MSSYLPLCSRSTDTASSLMAALTENGEDTTTDDYNENDEGDDDDDDNDDDDDDDEGDDDEGDEKEKVRGVSWSSERSKFVSWQYPVFCLFQCLIYSHGHI